MKVLPPLFQTNVTLTPAALKICKCDLDSGTHKDLVRAMAKVAKSELHTRELQRVTRPFRSAHARGARGARRTGVGALSHISQYFSATTRPPAVSCDLL